VRLETLLGLSLQKLSPLWAAKVVGDLPQNVNFALKASLIKGFLESRGVEYQTGPDRGSAGY
jgi:hypothetical protein